MLAHIHIRDFTIVDDLEVAFAPGMTALTGETGAGKSILVDAVGLALGDRGDSSWIRHGADRTEITLSFDIATLDAPRAWLLKHELDADDSCILRRIITRDGRSRGFINNSPVTMQALREIGELLVDIHGQHEHQSLTKPALQRGLLDDYAQLNAKLAPLVDYYRTLKETQEAFEQLKAITIDRTERLDMLRYQAQELRAQALDELDLEALDVEHERLAQADNMIAACARITATLSEGDDDTIQAKLSELSNLLGDWYDKDPQLTEAADLINSANINLSEGVNTLKRFHDALEPDPQALAAIETRLGQLHELSRKHHVAPEALINVQTKLEQELDALEHTDERLEALEETLKLQLEDYNLKDLDLHTDRVQAGKQLSKEVTELMQALGMHGGRFDINIVHDPKTPPKAAGRDQITFMVVTNPGQPEQPLAKIASGGELSRLSLAIQVAGTQRGGIATMIFDEVDVGIGGAVAESVGLQLHRLGLNRQTLCVTHLAQVASQANHHLQVTKLAGDQTTHARMRTLKPKEREEEIARMLGGATITDQTRAHAREMLRQSAALPGKKKASWAD
ncbi:MAG: DNA repair protein RecN [Gammaproteobacteria bacterium]|nr:MAG: DNA repair protein RecN [Gammaproteobacteria bacterium]